MLKECIKTTTTNEGNGEISKRHLNIVNGEAGPLPRVRWVGLVGICALARVCRVVSAKLANQILRLPVFECIG